MNMTKPMIANNLATIRKSACAIMEANHRLEPTDPVRKAIDGQLVRIWGTTAEIQGVLCASQPVLRGYKQDALAHFERLVEIYCASGDNPDREQMSAIAACAETLAQRIRDFLNIEAMSTGAQQVAA